MLCCCVMKVGRVLHKLTDNVNSKTKIKACIVEVMERANNTSR